MADLFQIQRALTAHLRDPVREAAPDGIEDRRLGIYRDLIYNNIEGFIAGAFPVLREVTPDNAWHSLVRDFISEHNCQSPYFLEISQEFLRYLQDIRGQRAGDLPFMLELAHYEWVELALDVAADELPLTGPLLKPLLDCRLQVSPLVWSLSYQYPVHRISPGFQPLTPGPTPCFLLVYRNRADQVRFMESNAVTVRLLQLLQAEPLTGRAALKVLAEELHHPDPPALVVMGEALMAQLLEADILLPV